MQTNTIEYMLSLSLLKQLKSQNLITEEEFTEIDLLNKKSFNSP
ncbi:SHOCT domain-containing protein [Paenibacillus sp. MZ04-78.2]|nr:SHOCT domain-containing protein [Paenibacillus sp. MZ04-78.2]